jgi:hypothetical protein
METEVSPHSLEATHSPRIDRIAGSDAGLLALIRQLVEVSREGLPRMYRSEERTFVHSLRRQSDGRLTPVGVSLRYGAIVLRGAQWLDEEGQRQILGGESAAEFCERLVRSIDEKTNLGDFALVTWNAADSGHPETQRLVELLAKRAEREAGAFTIEIAWALSALSAAHEIAADGARRVCSRLLNALPGELGVFPHQVDGSAGLFRSHVGSFADQVYPIQALSRFHRVSGDSRSLTVANRCAETICRLQGPLGEWWWHYDVRTGGVVEGYPVYSVHQDSMAPMTLLDLAEAGGTDYADEIRRGLLWLQHTPSVDRSLIDEANLVIWRKLARREPSKFVRKLNAVTSSFSPNLRLPMLDTLFPPVSVDWESRPYHLGWVLDGWLGHL